MERKVYVEELLLGINNEITRKIVTTLEKGYKGLYVILKVIKDQNGEVIAGDISNKLNISTARVAVALKTLERKKYITKYKSSADLRKTVVRLTPLGKEVLKIREEEINSLIEALLKDLTDEEIEQLIKIINKIKMSKA